MEAPDNKKTISILNQLIETLKDGEKGFQQAATEAKEADLKMLFGEYSKQRSKFARELQKMVVQLGGGEPETSGSVGSAIHRGWIGLKAALTNHDRHAILAECERGEDLAVKAYREALADSGLGVAARATVQQQYDGVIVAHNDLKKLRDTAAAVK